MDVAEDAPADQLASATVIKDHVPSCTKVVMLRSAQKDSPPAFRIQHSEDIAPLLPL